LLIARPHRGCGDFENQQSNTGSENIVPAIPASSTLYPVEYDMKLGSASLFGRLCCGLSLAVLAFAGSLDGSRAVRADDADDLTASLQEMIVDPIMKAIQGLDQRLALLEASVGGMAEQPGSRRVVAQVLCVADETGAQTCITKAQLDSLLSGIARAAASQPSVAVTEAKVDAKAEATVVEAKVAPIEEPVETAVSKDASRYPEPNSAPEEKSVAVDEDQTGTIPSAAIASASSGAAIVLNPEVEVTEEPAPPQALPAEPAPVQAVPQAAPSETGQSDD
jgi:hypothetical protein